MKPVRMLALAELERDEPRNVIPILTQVTDISMAALANASGKERRALLYDQVPALTSKLLSFCREDPCLSAGYNFVARWKGLLSELLRPDLRLSSPGSGVSSEDSLRQLQAAFGAIPPEVKAGKSAPSPADIDRIGKLIREAMEAADAGRKNRLADDTERVIRAELARQGRSQSDIDGVVASFRSRTEKMGAAEIEDFSRSFLRYQAGIDPSALSTDVPVRALLKPDEALIDIYRYSSGGRDGREGTRRYVAILLGRDFGPKAFEMGAAEPLEDKVSAWRREVTAASSVAEQQMKELADSLWVPLETALPEAVRRVLISPDGELNKIPWASLRVDRLRPLQVAQLASILHLSHLRGQPSLPASPTGFRILLIGNVDYGNGPAGTAIEALPGTAEEIQQIADSAAARRILPVVREGDRATKEQILRELAGFRFIHVATHGFLEKLPASAQELVDREPLSDSRLALSGANRLPFEKAYLTAEELARLDLRQTELVAMSACDTGLGAPMTGQGVIGLQSAVLCSGARSMLMSLWKVPSDATTALMTEFYDGIWRRGLSKTESLRRAQEVVRKGGTGRNWRNPVFWAGWVLSGEVY